MYRIFQKYEMVVINKPLFFSRMHKLQTSKVLKNEAIFEKKIFLISKINEIRKIYKKSNLLSKIYIIFFLRLKNINEISFEIKKLINNENIFFTLILKIIFLMSELYISTKKKDFKVYLLAILTSFYLFFWDVKIYNNFGLRETIVIAILFIFNENINNKFF